MSEHAPWTPEPDKQREWAINRIIEEWEKFDDDEVPVMTSRMAEGIAHLAIAPESCRRETPEPADDPPESYLTREKVPYDFSPRLRSEHID